LAEAVWGRNDKDETRELIIVSDYVEDIAQRVPY
jgi:hypothetical protein